jgi:hypothetical protein
VVELLPFERLAELPRVEHRRRGAHFVRRLAGDDRNVVMMRFGGG